MKTRLLNMILRSPEFSLHFASEVVAQALSVVSSSYELSIEVKGLTNTQRTFVTNLKSFDKTALIAKMESSLWFRELMELLFFYGHGKILETESGEEIPFPMLGELLEPRVTQFQFALRSSGATRTGPVFSGIIGSGERIDLEGRRSQRRSTSGKVLTESDVYRLFQFAFARNASGNFYYSVPGGTNYFSLDFISMNPTSESFGRGFYQNFSLESQVETQLLGDYRNFLVSQGIYADWIMRVNFDRPSVVRKYGTHSHWLYLIASGGLVQYLQSTARLHGAGICQLGTRLGLPTISNKFEYLHEAAICAEG